jgi:oxalate decarboxylase/phosphoglucose isomerase-like protein (cupin superfamily)
MTDGLMLPPGAGTRVPSAGMTLKIGAERSATWSMFEAEVAPGFDVGAHRHAAAEEVFYVLDGELDLLAFEPEAMTAGDWRAWTSGDGATVLRGGPGSVMWVPPGCPHAFANPLDTPARLLFLVAPSGHEDYLAEVGRALASAGGAPDPAVIAAVRARHDIEQLTPMRRGPAQISTTA